jgi:hypothetical protein
MGKFDDIRRALDARDPETLIGPALLLLTWLARSPTDSLRRALRDHLLALALHPGVDTEVRLSAGSLAIELRNECGSSS